MIRYSPIFIVVISSFLISCKEEAPTGLGNDFWTETAVRKVLHVFAYGGQASDAQITIWADMKPRTAIRQMLTFDETNPLLSPTVDSTAAAGGTLTALQGFWSSANVLNPMREDLRTRYPTLNSTNQRVTPTNLRYTWVASINKRGLNPFRQKVGLFLTNYHMAVSTRAVRAPLVRRLYDDVMDDLALGVPFQNVLARGATSAAVAMQYGHRNNTYDNTNLTFRGNDDFAREYHQLFFRVLGEDYTQDYHENTTIEHTAWVLTGMDIDRELNAWGSINSNDYWLDFIDFTDHVDAANRGLFNTSNHYANDLEVLGSTITGTTAQEKIQALSQVAINERESLDKMPVFIINYFADDNLNAEKLDGIRTLWRNTVPKNLLTFLQEYAISPFFHRADTYKYRTAFSRNLALFNINTVDNEEAYLNSWTPLWIINQQGALPFAPAHEVFGGQTAINAANNPDIFKTAYNAAVDSIWFVIKYTENYTDSGGNQTWYKDWARAIPANDTGEYRVNDVGEWLWQRLIADGLKNYGPLERAYVNGFLATGNDFGLIVDSANPDVNFNPTQLNNEPYLSSIVANESTIMNLDSTNPNLRLLANRNVGMAMDFISMTPFMFAIEAL
ncbi:MAG: hypothetical protein ACC641_04615 [Acidiferrobacterales bacterium]